MRRIALINQKGGVGKTTTAVNLGAALALEGQRVVLVDLDPQGNLTMHLGLEEFQSGSSDSPTTYNVLVDSVPFGNALRETEQEGLRLVPTDIDLSGAELELANAFGRETLLRDAVDAWAKEHREAHGEDPADYVLFDCPPSLGLLAINGLAAANGVFIPVQTQFFALQGMTKLVDVVRLVQRRIHPDLEIEGIVPCLYDSRQRLAREVLAEIREYFPGLVFRQAIGTNVKLAEAPSFGQTIFQYAPGSVGARDYRNLAQEVMQRAASETADETAEQPDAEADKAATGTAEGSSNGTDPELEAVEIQPTPPTKATPEPAPTEGASDVVETPGQGAEGKSSG